MQSKSILKNTKGVAAIEMAIVLPILLVIIMAVLEFGLYFLKEQAASRAVSTASMALQQKPGDGTIKLTMQKNGLGMMDLAAEPDNFVCAKAYATADAANLGSCLISQWDTATPQGVPSGGTYYIAVRAFAVHTPLTPIRALTGAFPPDIDQRNVVSINVASPKGMTVLNSPIGGSSTWTVPAGVTQIKVTVIGGGGGGSGGGYGAFAGGGGAGTVIAYIGDLVPGTNIPYSIGRGGYGGAAPGSKDGTDTIFNGIVANAGGGGHAGNGGASGGFNPVTSVTHGSVKGYAGIQGQGGSYYGTGGHSGGGFGAGAHTTSNPSGYSGLAFGGGGGSSSTGGGGDGGPGGIIIEW